MRLNGLFDVLRGWPREGAIDETFPAHVTGGTVDTIVPGMVVTVGTDGAVIAADTPDRTAADGIPTWVVVEGTDDFSGEFLSKAVCLRSNAMFRLDPANFIAGTYAVGTPLSFDSGKWQEAAIKEQIIGEVIRDDRAIDDTIVVMYTGGSGAKLT
jgi:hypothetical protein